MMGNAKEVRNMKQNQAQKLLTQLSIVQKLSLQEAMTLLGVSESTARRWFVKLEREGHAIRVHGGIQAVDAALTRYSFEQGVRTHMKEKFAIAKQAVHYLEDEDVIFCDSGTTIRCFCAELINLLKKKKLNIKIYTNSLANLELLSPHIQVNLVGGIYRVHRKDFCGYLAEQALHSVFFTKSFVGADGCVNYTQFTTTDYDTARMNQVAIRNSRQTFMLLDSSKFKKQSHVNYVSADCLHTIITDSKIKAEARERLKQEKVRLVCVEEGL